MDINRVEQLAQEALNLELYDCDFLTQTLAALKREQCRKWIRTAGNTASPLLLSLLPIGYR